MRRLYKIYVIFRLNRKYSFIGGIYMKFVMSRKKYSFLGVLCIICLAVIMKFTISFGMQNYYNAGFTTGLVTATTLNVRSGPGISYKTIATVKKNEYIR